ncbi:glutamate 5-kinase [Pseudokordiimonas caeni]|uniref:glutamate 5-kinase n=1 Tax=Pseudokordiimonas caeni TaxID=2997908 RepID=UPI00281175F2|nr:glutamate 5-kinase [Pseudokordiimonas caeni]
MTTFSDRLKDTRRIVLKIGSALLIDGNRSVVREAWLNSLADDVAALKARGIQVILVSSGAIAMGREAIGYSTRPDRLEDAQAAAAVGQIRLAGAYQDVFAKRDIVVGQILLTLDDLEERPSYLNARNTLETLLDRGIVPVINENDTVATTEIRFGDNDRLSARVAHLTGADLLILFSDIDGLYETDPRKSPDAPFVSVVEKITPAIDAMAGPPGATTAGTGGMITKLAAAKIAMAGGCSMIIAKGEAERPVGRLIDGERHTIFIASEDPLTIRKRWIRGLMAPQGFAHLDDGAVAAIRGGASLLPAGVTGVDGNFNRGSLIALLDRHQHLVGQGLAAYGSVEADKIKGCQIKEISSILGYSGRSALVHRDDMVIF